MDTSKLRPDTARVWQAMSGHPRLKGFVLIGGTALTLRIGHRVSEDLDFACHLPKLPPLQVKALVRDLATAGVELVPNPNPLDVESFMNDGLQLADYQQDFVARASGQGAQGGVKVSLVCLDPPSNGFVGGSLEDEVRVATLDEIFKTKAWVCCERSKTRDWFDLYTLMTAHGYGFEDVYAAYASADRLPSFNIAAMRLRACKPESLDEGYLQLAGEAPTLEQMRGFFNEGLDALQVQQAKNAFRAKALGLLRVKFAHF